MIKWFSPRIFKTHSQWEWVPKDDAIKYIYCYRNPKDVAVSYYYHLLLFHSADGYNQSFDEFFSDIFMKKGKCHHGFYFDHVAEWLLQKDNKNILFLTYEDMVENLTNELKRIAIFLNYDLGEDKFKQILANSTVTSMQNNDKVNYTWVLTKDPTMNFIRKGTVGDWMNHMSKEQSEEVEKYVEEQLVPLGAKIRYTLA